MKRLHLLILFCFSQFVYCQDVQLTVQTGHSAAIKDVVFSPFDDFIASAGADHKIVLWDFATTKQFKVLLGHTGAITAISFHPDNELLISSSLDSTVKIWNYLNGELLNEIRFNYPVYNVTYNDNGDKYITVGKEVRIYNQVSNTYQQLSIRPKNYFSTASISNNDNFILVGGKTERLAYLINWKDDIIAKRFTYPVISASFNEAKNLVLFSTNNGIAVSYNYVSEKKKSRSTDWMLTTINDIVSDSSAVYLADDYGNIRVLEQEKWFQIAVFKGKQHKINSVSLSHDRRFLAAGGESESVVVWDLKTQRVVKVMKGLVNSINDIEFSSDGTEILVAYEDGSLRKTNLISNQTIVNKMELNSDVLTKIGKFSVVNIISFNQDYAELNVLYKQAHLNKEGVFDKLIEFDATWIFVENIIQFVERPKLKGKSEQYISDLKVNKYHENTFFQSEITRTDSFDSLSLIAHINNSKLLLKNTKTNNIIHSIETAHTDLVTSVAFNEKFGFVATAGWDGMIRFWNIESAQLMTIFGAFGDGQFVYVNPDGYYFSSKDALGYIGFSLNNKVFSFEQFDLKYNRPDLVIADLPYFEDFYEEAFEKAYKKRLDKLGIKESDIEVSADIPTLEVLNDFSASLIDNKLEVSLKCQEEVLSLERLYLNVNGVPEFGRFGKEIEGKIVEEKFTITLNPGTNIIQMYVTNTANMSSLKKTFKVEAPARKEKSKLFILSIGVSDYQQSNYNLSYASKDAKDVGSMFSIFTKHQVKKSMIMIDSMVTKESIMAMENFMADAGENDVVVLFVAGHGVLDDNLDYFFAPYDMDFQNPSKNGVPFSVFDEILENTKSRKKLMFLDACHSGEIDKDEVVKTFVSDDHENNQDLIFRRAGRTIRNIDEINSFDLSKALFADMRLNNGATVISSSGGAEYAIEGDEWNNGVFTYVLLTGLLTKDADKNKDKRITISELQAYIQNGVSDRTGGMQTPTSRVENLNYDFVIAKKWSD